MTTRRLKVLPFIITNSAITIHFKTGPLSIVSENPNFDAVQSAIAARDFETAHALMSPREVIVQVLSQVTNSAPSNEVGLPGESVITIEGDIVYWNGSPTSGYVVDKILQMQEEGENVKPLVKFLEKLYLNPSETARNELYLFMEKSGLSLTEDGDVVCYKKVREDFKDFYTGTMDNSPGKTLVYDRSRIDTNRHNTCSNGLHVCSASYLKHYHGGVGRTIRVVVDPRHFVTIPSDYNNAKARVEQYRVVDDLGQGSFGDDAAATKKASVDRTTVTRDWDAIVEKFRSAWDIAEDDGKTFTRNDPENVTEAYDIADILISAAKHAGVGTSDAMSTVADIYDNVVGDSESMTSDQLRSWFESRRKIVDKVFPNYFIVKKANVGGQTRNVYGFSGNLS